ncbi:addiction module toxin RelE (plasmid) [Tardibacter chloracetimidivorans]|uniref:Addiction module toxin RelE n=1 Tax=Tardibacter chloracetimidivorans TaxID=1921510 RepID=A0A1L4A0K4_9SPHN|nr:type II toxin-antitoxin system RelE/ParE family toxin [Tardibacter chloracetimidivorans]API61405.1 addiction module toxin RelE [Tardibacter chloracetimidivorans]
MSWDVAFDAEFLAWLQGQDDRIRIAIFQRVELLAQIGPSLGRPHVDTLQGSAHSNMKELRVQIGGEPWRIFFAFDPKRSAILLVGGNKAGDKRFYDVNIPIADARYTRHLASLDGDK